MADATNILREANERARRGDTRVVTVVVRKMPLKYKILLILVSLTMMATLRTGFVFFVIGMMPSIVAYYMDPSKQRYTFKSVFYANLSGIMHYILKIIHAGPSSQLLQETMGNSIVWFTIYGASFLGWLLVKICPMISQIMVNGVHSTQLTRYSWMQKRIESEWGPEVTQFSVDQR